MSDTSDRRLTGVYTGNRDTLLPLAVKTGVLTLVTLGVYRFWERTRIRRYIWSSISPGGDPFEYTGTGLEKFLGFLVAMVFLAVTLALVQIALMFVGLSVFAPGEDGESSLAAIAFGMISSAILVPLAFFARYRARRYRMARTRWRGIRFGVLPGAPGYAWRGTLLLALTVASLGALWPLMTFTLEKYIADRTFFGNARLMQGGRWTMLYPAMRQIGLGVGILVLGFVLAATGTSGGLAFVCMIAGVPWILIGTVVYRARAYTILTRTKVLGDGIRLGADVRGGEMVSILLGGALKTFLAGLLVSGVFAATLAASGLGELLTFEPQSGGVVLPSLLQMVISLFGTLATLMVYGVLWLIFVQQPMLACKVCNSWVENPIALTAVKQRAADDMADADGFADALDVGGVF